MADPTIRGFHAAAADRAEQRIDVLARLVAHPEATFCVRVGSDALASLAIRTGDTCVVDRSLTPRDGDIVIATQGEDLVVRRISIPAQGPPVLRADPPIAPVALNPDTGIEVWGVVNTIVRQLR